MDTLEKITKQGKEINPFNLLGIDSWVLRSLDFNAIKRFISDFRRIVGKYHHPDLFIDNNEKEKHQKYFSLVTSAIDRLLNDDFYFRKSLEDLRTGDMLRRMQREHSQESLGLKNKLETAEEEMQKLTKEIIKKDNALQNVSQIFGDIKRAERFLIDSGKSAPLLPGLKYRLNFVYLHGISDSLSSELPNIFASTKNPIEIEKSAQTLAKNYIHTGYEINQEKGKLKNKKMPIFDAEVQGRDFSVFKRNGKKDDASPGTIVGGLTYNALKGYFEFNKIPIVKKDEDILELSPLVREFVYNQEDSLNRSHTMPYISNFIFPYSLALVRFNKKHRGKPKRTHNLILTIGFSKM